MSLFKSYKTLRSYRKDPLGFIVKSCEENGPRSYYNIFGIKLLVFSDPGDVLHVLKTNPGAYSKGRTTRALKQFLGNGLVTNEGDSWRKQHRLIRPIMNLKSVINISPQILGETLAFLPEISKAEGVNALKEMNRLAWRIILRTLFSYEITREMDDWLEDILDLMRIITSKTRSSIPIPFWIPTSKHRRHKEIIRKFDLHVYKMIDERRQGHEKHDLLQHLINAHEDGVATMSDREIRDEVMTFMMAGHETITNTLTWLILELGKNTKYQNILKQEAQEFFANKDFNQLNNMPWHNAIVDEVMRLWPAIWVFMRTAEVDDKIGELSIPKKTNVVLAPYLTHRLKHIWSDPELFYPERFLPEAKKHIPPGAFYPYGLGPRGCIGSHFAGLEAKIILAALVHHFDWQIENPEEQLSEAGISLRPLNNTNVKFRKIS